MEKNLHKKIAPLEVFDKAYKSAIKKIRIQDNFAGELRDDNLSILKEYADYIERSLKKTDKIACYHWETNREQDGENLKCFSDLGFAKSHYVREHLSDANALEIYLMDKKLKDKCKTECACTLVPKDYLELFTSIDMSFSKDKPNFFEDIKFRDEEEEYQDTINCSM